MKKAILAIFALSLGSVANADAVHAPFIIGDAVHAPFIWSDAVHAPFIVDA